MERQMFAEILVAGVSADSWILHQIMMDLMGRQLTQLRDNSWMRSRVERATSMWRDLMVALKELEDQLEQGEESGRESEEESREK